jgi:hypothetical protein
MYQAARRTEKGRWDSFSKRADGCLSRKRLYGQLNGETLKILFKALKRDGGDHEIGSLR